jgi:hypothetical protein
LERAESRKIRFLHGHKARGFRSWRIMKHDISWHENCLKNSKASYDREFIHLENERKRFLKWKEDDLFLQEQIDEAKRRGKDSFDEEKFMKTKKVT